MSISTEQLESLKQKLLHLAERLKADGRPSDGELQESDPLLVEAAECDFILPSPLTLASLAATVDKKVENVDVLLQRSRMHESLPPDAQAAAEEDLQYMDGNYADEPPLPGSADSQQVAGEGDLRN